MEENKHELQNLQPKSEENPQTLVEGEKVEPEKIKNDYPNPIELYTDKPL